jgi:DNA-binding transcriptional regulator YdaS (Cro superfamily)
MSRKQASIKEIIDAAGGPVALGRKLGITGAAVSQWNRVPVERVLRVESETGIPRHRIRPDIYPAQDAAA